MTFNSLVPVRFQWTFRLVIFKFIDGRCISCEIALMWMSMDLTDDKSTLVQVMAWCRQATSHYMNQCWPRSMTPCDVTRPPNDTLSCTKLHKISVAIFKDICLLGKHEYLQKTHENVVIHEKTKSTLSPKLGIFGSDKHYYGMCRHNFRTERTPNGHMTQ